MKPSKRNERKGKNNCDLCQQERPPIHEFEFRLHSRCAHWIDLCAECGSVDRSWQDGFIVGIHACVTRPQNQKLTPGKRIHNASGFEEAQIPVQRNKRAVATIVEG